MTQTSGRPVVLDVKDPWWPPRNLSGVLEWLRGNGIDPDITTRVEVLPSEAGPVATVHQWKVDGGGKLCCDPDGEPVSVVREVRVSSLPPRPKGGAV